MTKRNQTFAAGAGAVCVLASWLLFGSIGVPGTRSSGSPEDADYCNILLVPSVAEKIGLDLPMRIRAAKRGAGLLYHLRNGSGHMPVILGANKVSDKLGSNALARAGEKARLMLPPDAREKFEDLFSDGQLVRVGFWTEKKKRPGFPGGATFIVTYGWYAEEKDRTKPKSLRACEDQLDDCYRWIPDSEEADLLLEHEDKDVRWAAEKWWRKMDNEPQQRQADFEKRFEESRQRFAATREESLAKQEEFRRRMEERREEWKR